MRAKVSLKALCQGVCSVSELNRIRNGEREPDRFKISYEGISGGEDQGKKDESIECFTQAFYISCLMKMK